MGVSRIAGLSIITMTLSLLPQVSVLAASAGPDLTAVACPEKLILGERGKVSLLVSNNLDQQLRILKFSFVLDGNESNVLYSDQLGSSSQAMQPKSQITLSAAPRFDAVGYHYIDLSLNYSTNETGIRKLQLCEVQVLAIGSSKDDFEVALATFQSSPLVSVLILAPIGGFIVFVLQRHFTNKDSELRRQTQNSDFELQQKIQHRTWLLQSIHSLASNYYIPLAKYAFEAESAIALAEESKSDQAVKSAFYYFSLLISKYVEFERKVGGNYLFIQRSEEQKAIGLHQALAVLSPIDQNDMNAMAKEILVKDSELTSEPKYSGQAFEYFRSWIISAKCSQSKCWLKRQLRAYANLLDRQGERISQPDFFMTTIDELDSERDGTKFWITYHMPYCVKENEEVTIMGNGFKDPEIQYSFDIGGQTPTTKAVSDNILKLTIPKKLGKGTFDISATFTTQGKKDVTIGIVVHVIDS